MNPTQISSEERATASALIAQLGELESLLGNEYDAIRQRDLVQLDALTRDKQTLIESINRSATTLGDVLARLLGDKSSTPGKQLHALIARCGQANKTNGCAIESSQSFTTSLLDILRGRSPSARTYTARGRLGQIQGASAFIRV